MKALTIEVRIGFKGEMQRDELASDIAKAVGLFGYQPIEGIASTEPGTMALGFEKENVTVRKPDAPVKPKAKAKKVKAPKKPKAKKVKKKK